jgi:NADH-quinone oxidoreductase subunit G
VRFITEVAGIPELGQTGRGEDSEITSYLGAMLTSEMQGNVIDLCPVGALTSKPYAFTARPWELKKTESIDVIDALGSNIRVDVRGREVMRILPRNHDGVNEEWLSDRSRFIWDGLRRQRLDAPYIRQGGKLVKATWAEAFDAIRAAADGKAVNAIAGDLAPAEAMFALKQLVESLDGKVECRTDGARLPADRFAYAGTARIEDIDAAEIVMIIGGNPRDEAPVLNARIRKAWSNGASVVVLGAPVDLTYPHHNVGADTADLARSIEQTGDMARDKNVVIVLCASALTREDGAAVLAAAVKQTEVAGGKLLILHTAASRVGGMDVGFTTEGGIKDALGADVIWNLGADEIDIAPGAFVVYQGSHGDRGAHRADVILPAAAFTEETGIFVNTEGRPQIAGRAGFPPGEAKENWAILRAASAALGKTLPYDSLGALRAAMFKDVPHLAQIDAVPEQTLGTLPEGPLSSAPFAAATRDHFLINPICRASTTMAELSRLKEERGLQVAAE